MTSGSESVLVPANTTVDNSFQLELESSSRWNEEPEHEYLLPQADGGRDAWLFLAAAFAIEIMVWGEYLPRTKKPQSSLHQSTTPDMTSC
jgi:hypothetical protein